MIFNPKTDSDEIYAEDVLVNDETAALYGLTSGATADDVFNNIPEAQLSFKVGDTITTARTDLGDDWLLCNGDAITDESYSQLLNVLNVNSPNGRGMEDNWVRTTLYDGYPNSFSFRVSNSRCVVDYDGTTYIIGKVFQSMGNTWDDSPAYPFILSSSDLSNWTATSITNIQYPLVVKGAANNGSKCVAVGSRRIDGYLYPIILYTDDISSHVWNAKVYSVKGDFTDVTYCPDNATWYLCGEYNDDYTILRSSNMSTWETDTSFTDSLGIPDLITYLKGNLICIRNGYVYTQDSDNWTNLGRKMPTYRSNPYITYLNGKYFLAGSSGSKCAIYSAASLLDEFVETSSFSGTSVSCIEYINGYYICLSNYSDIIYNYAEDISSGIDGNYGIYPSGTSSDYPLVISIVYDNFQYKIYYVKRTDSGSAMARSLMRADFTIAYLPTYAPNDDLYAYIKAK